MKRLTIAVAAVALIATSGAFAQIEPAPPPALEQPPETEFRAAQTANELILADIIGHPVINLADETLGDIQSIVFAPDGEIVAVTIGVGGFLGIGEKEVAIPFAALEQRADEDGVINWYFDASREALEAAPDFVRLDEEGEAAAAVEAGPFLAAQSPEQMMLDDLRGRPIVNGADETLGTADAVVFTREGRIVAVIVGVGGFLGLGEKDVAIAFEALQPVAGDNGDLEWLFQGTADELADAPDFMTRTEADEAAIRTPEVRAEIDEEGGGLPAAGFADIAAEVTPAVVSVRVRTPAAAAEQATNPLAPYFDRFGMPDTQPPTYAYGEGSGFFISADGFVVTNNHVVEGADQVALVLGDGSIYPARVVGTDPRTDLALLKVDADRAFPFVVFSEEEARIGDWILAVGNPFGLGGTVTLGIVSALGRDIGAGPYDDFMQIDAAINRGNSGGPAFNLSGEVIGVNSAIASPTGASVGIGFAIPAYIAQEVVADLQDDGVVERGWLGVQIQPIGPDMAEALGLDGPGGALVVAAAPDGPAARAGLQSEDAILAVAGEEVEDPRQLARLIASHDPGEQVRLTVWRDEAEVTIDVVLGALPGEPQQVAANDAPAAQTPPAPVEGIGLAVAPAENLGEGRQGVVVAMVDANGAAARSGLQPGDIITEVDGTPVATPAELADALSAARNAARSVVLLRVIVGESEGLVALRLS